MKGLIDTSAVSVGLEGELLFMESERTVERGSYIEEASQAVECLDGRM